MRPTWRVALAVAAVALLVWLLLGRGGSGSGDDHGAQPPTARRGSPEAIAAARARLQLPRPYATRASRLALRGRVIDIDGEPVEAAAVRLAGLETRATTTDAAGRFGFAELAAGSYFVSAAKAPLASAPVAVHLGPDSGELVVRVFGAATLEVRVVALDGEDAISGARVSVLAAAHLGDRPVAEAVTDASGTATLPALTPGSYSVTATADGYRAVEMPVPPQAGLSWSMTVRMVPGAPVRGVVVSDDGDPVAGAIVQPIPAQMKDAYLTRPRDTRTQTRTDDDGRFTVPALEEGQFVLRATHPSYQAGQSDPLISDGATARDGVRIVVARGGRIAGRVVDADGAPAPFAEVRINAADPMAAGAGLRTVRTDAAGAFAIEGLPRLPVELVAQTPAASSTNLAFDLAEAPAYDGVVVPLALDGIITGVVVDADGAPIADAEVVCVGHKIGAIGLRPVLPETTDADGRFACAGLAPGEHALTARRPYANNNQSPWRRSVGTTAEPGDAVTMVLPDDGGVRGAVTFSDGAPAPEFEVSVDDSGASQTVRDADGRFVLDGLSPGSYQLVLSIGTRSRTVDIEVVPGKTIDVGTVAIGE
jgi:protocatechuate 3,4-dioxygenase beta subunit